MPQLTWTPNSKKLSALTRLMLSRGLFLQGPPSFPGPELSFVRARGIVRAGLSSDRWLECQSNGAYRGVRTPRRRYFQMHREISDLGLHHRRSEKRRVGKECDSTSRFGLLPAKY